MYDSKALATLLVAEAEAKQATDVNLIYVGNISDFADYFLICTANSPLQIQAIVDACELCANRGGVLLQHKDGVESSGWVLLDFSNVVVHIFLPDQRAYYGLDQLWANGVILRKESSGATLIERNLDLAGAAF